MIPIALDMHLYFVMTGQGFVLPLAIQHWLCSHKIFLGTDSPENCRDHRCLGLLGLVLTPKVLSLFKYTCYSSYSQLLYSFFSLYFNFCPFTGIFHLSGSRLWLNMYLQLRSPNNINSSIRLQTLIVLVLYHLSYLSGASSAQLTLYSEIFDRQ